MAIAQKLAGYSLGQADILRRAMGKKKKEELDKQYDRLLRRHERARLLRERRQDALGHPAPVLRLRLQQGPLRGVRPGLLLDRLPQGQLPRRVHGGAPHLGEGRQGQDGDLPQRVPPDEDPGAAARRQRVAARPSPRSATTSASASPPIRNVGGNVVAAIVEARQEQGRYERLQRLPGQGPRAGLQQAGHRVAGQGRRLRRHEAPAPGAGGRPRGRRSTSTSTSSATRRSARTPSSTASRPAPTAAASASRWPIPDLDEWDKMTLLGHEREMLGLYVSDHPLLGLEHLLANGSDCTHRPADARRGPRRRLADHDHRPDHLRAAQDHQARRQLGDGHGRGPRRRDRRAAVPERLPAGQHRCSPRTRSSRSGAGSRAARTSPRSTARR